MGSGMCDLSLPSRWQGTALCLAAFSMISLCGCGSTGVTDGTDLDGPVHGSGNETKFVAGTDGSDISLGDLARIGKTIRKYKNLGADDQEVVRRVASLKLDGLMAARMQILAPQFERRKAVLRQQSETRLTAVRQQAAVSRKPAREVEQEVAAVKSQESAAFAQIDLEWKSAARAEVTRIYGSDFAVPMQNPENKAVVAFASLKDSGVSVSAASYEVSGNSSQLVAAAAEGRKISHEGASYTLLDATGSLR